MRQSHFLKRSRTVRCFRSEPRRNSMRAATTCRPFARRVGVHHHAVAAAPVGDGVAADPAAVEREEDLADAVRAHPREERARAALRARARLHDLRGDALGAAPDRKAQKLGAAVRGAHEVHLRPQHVLAARQSRALHGHAEDAVAVGTPNALDHAAIEREDDLADGGPAHARVDGAQQAGALRVAVVVVPLGVVIGLGLGLGLGLAARRGPRSRAAWAAACRGGARGRRAG